MACPNINLDSWKNLVAARGEDVAYYLWDKHDGAVPESESKSEIVKAGLKATNALQSDKAAQLFNTLQKNRVTGDAFWNKLQQDLQIPKEQIELLKQYNTTDREQLITNMLADYSFAIEIDITTQPNTGSEFIKVDGKYYRTNIDGEFLEEVTKEQAENERGNIPAQYYSNLTVPGGTNYTENEIATPAITPSIKGHAQFATDQGIGWFRSDDRKYTEEIETEELENDEDETSVRLVKSYPEIGGPKTRRILEVQSDLFQKGRDKEFLSKNINRDSEYQIEVNNVKYAIANDKLYSTPTYNYNLQEVLDIDKVPANVKEWFNSKKLNNKENQFLQLLNKANNWVTFFVKSIIQDSAKKGYEKVVFPTGSTAYKIESGGNTIEDFIRNKENRIEQLEKDLEKEPESTNGKYTLYIMDEEGDVLSEQFDTLKEAEEFQQRNFGWTFSDEKVGSRGRGQKIAEIERLRKEIKDAREGTSGLAATARFYQEAVANVLKKQGYTPKQITDEYGNTWNEVTISPERESARVLFQTEAMPVSKASKETLDKVKEVLKKMGVDVQALTEYAKANPEVDVTSVNGVADLVKGVIAIAEGREDVALTEEMVHIATAILEQTNPKMVTDMIAKIDRFQIYKQTLEAYKNNKAYQLPNGKPDIRKIKKEAVDKLIAELIVNQNDGSTEFPELMQEENRSLVRRWWDAITDWFRGAYKKTNISVFEEAARAIVAGEVTGQVSQIEDGGVFFQVSEAQKKIQDKILETRNSIKKVESEEKNDPMFMDTEEANNWYEKKDNEGVYKRVTKRVTDRVKSWYAARFPGKTFTAEEKKFNELKRSLGVKGHKDFEEIHARFFNADGTRKTKPDPRPTKFNLEDVSMYETLENYYVDLIDSFSKEGQSPLVFSETIIFDDKTNEAGTVDLLIVEPSGKTSIIDWKFMQINGEDIAWFKQGAFNIQLTRYKEILRDNYGVKQFGLNRAIPISMKLGLADRANPKSPTVLKGIAMGSVDTTKIEDLTLVPVSQESESTGYTALDKLLTELNAILKQIQKETVSDEDEREFKIERMNTLKRAMRMAQGTMNMSGLIKVITVMRKEGDNLVNEYKTVYENLPASSTDVNNAQLSDFADNMRNFMEAAAVLGRVDDAIRDLIYNEQWEKDAKTEEEKEALAARKQIAINLSEEARKIRINTTEIENSYKKFADKHIGERNLVTGLLNDEAVVKGFSRLFRGVSDLPTAALQLLTKITGAAKLNASQDAISKVDRLLEIRKKLADRGGDLRRLVQTIYQKDEKGSIVNKLIYKYSKEFYDAVKEKAIAGGDLKWLRDNVDIESYKKEAFTIMERNINRIKNNNYGETEAEDSDTKDRLILQEQRKWDIDRDDFNGFNNYILKRHPQSKWYSEEYRQIMQDEDLLELYNFITSYNSYARDLGYIDNRVASIFLPFVSKSMAESIAWDYGTTAVTNFANDLTINVEDVGYGNINALTGELENSIPKYYTYDFTFENGVNDYSMVSEDLFKNVILYIQQVEKYKYLSEVEGQINLVRTVEKFKNHLTTGKTGDLIIKDGSPVVEKGNEDNAKLFDQFTRALLYGQKYSVSDSDTPLYIGNVINFMKTAVNRVAGKEIFKPSENPSPTSLVKTMDATNRAFALKLLGGDPISGLVNWFGANVQLSAQAGNYFKAREFLKNEGKLVGNRFSNSEEREMFIQMIDLFLPMKEDPNYDKLRQAGMTTLTRMNFSDILMVFMREPEQHVEKTLFLTLLDNTMVENGKIVNIREFVKKKYTGRSRSSEAYKTAKEAIEKEIEELKSTRSISATKQLVDGKLVIPGLDMNNRQEIQRLSNLTRRISRNITGSLSEDDINMMQMSVWTRSMMVFKNWIPKLVDTRFGEFRKVSDDFSVQIDDDGNITGEKYDIGRLRLWFRVIGTSFVDKSSNVLNILNMNDKGVLALDKLYDQMRDEYEKNTGKTMNLSRDDFADMIRDNLRNQIKELSIIAALMAATFALGFAAPDDDEDRAAKNTFRYYAKVLDKFTDELTFFYSPEGIEGVLKGSILPAISIFSDIISFTKHMGMEITGYDFDPETSDEKVRENAKPVKKFVRLFPVGKTVLTYMGMFSSEFAKEYDITIQKESSIR